MSTNNSLSLKKYIEDKKNSKTVTLDSHIFDYAYTGDKKAFEILSKFEKIKEILEPIIRVQRDAVKAELLGNGVRVTAEQFPKIYKLILECSQTLGIPTPEVFIHQNIQINAGTIGTNEDAVIILNNGLVDQLDEDELRFVLGHECGHIQNGHVTYGFMAYLFANIMSGIIGILAMPFVLALKHWSRQAEITCDRAGLICSKNLDKAKYSLVKSALGSKELFKQINMEEYLTQLEDIRENSGRFYEFLDSHPLIVKRVKSLELYEKTENYHLKKGDLVTTSLTLAEADAQIEKILKIL
ncbi:MAG: M48 family metallopeptidase [Cyanobacteriota bacterium]